MITPSFHHPIPSTVYFVFIFLPVLIANFHGFIHYPNVQGFVLHSGPDHSKLLFSLPTTSENWEVAHLKFLTPIRHKRDLSQRDFHILQLHRPSENSTLTLHLTKKPTLLSPLLKVVVHDGNENDNVKEIKSDDSDSVFRGTVTTSTGSDDSDSVFRGTVTTSTGSDDGGGQAALSACNEHAGLCGLIVTDQNEHLMIQPHPQSDNFADSDQSNLHVLLRIDDTVKTSQCTSSDEVRVPPEKLKAAAAALYQPDGHSRDIKSSSSSRDGLPSLGSSLLTPLLPSSPSSSRDEKLTPSSGSLHSYASNSGWNSGMNLKSDKKIVEIAVFTDEDLYHQLRKRFPKDTIKKIKDYAITMINTMDMLYQHKSLGVGLEFSLVHLEIMKKYPSKLNKNGGRAMAYLTSFCDYAGEKNTNSEMWDHALLLTGMDLREDDTTATAGLAWAGTMCYRYYSCSISEGTSFGAAYIITHEIGHSLGMEHDGNGVSKSCDREKYLMSPTTGPGKIEWSSCSQQNLKDFLQYGTSELRNTKNAHKPLCLSESGVTKGASGDQSNHKINVPDGGGQLPGQKYNASQQCILAMGNMFKPVLRKTEPPFDNICWMLYCGNGTHAISTHPALEGSKCDDGKYCRSGKCTKRS